MKNGESIDVLLMSDTDFGEVIKQLQSKYNFTQFVEDDSPDEFQPLVNILQDSPLGPEVWTQGDFTLYHEDQVYRLCQSDTSGSYSIYLW